MKPLRILVIRIGAMGDVLHAMPAVAALRAQHPEAFIGWAIEPHWSDLLQIAGDEDDLSQGIGRAKAPAMIDRWYSVPTKKWSRRPLSGETFSELALLKELLRDEKFDLVVDLQGSVKSAAVGWMAGGKTFAGPDAPREKTARRLYKQKIPVQAEHVVEQACEILGGALGEKLAPGRPTLPMDPKHEMWANEEIGNPRFCLISPTAGWGAKMWPAERYGEVARELDKLGYATIVNAIGPDDAVARRVVEASGDIARAVPCSVGQLIALVRRAELVIGGDTGPVHLAAVLGHPVVAIYGPTSPTRNGPWGTRSRVLRDEESVTNHKRVKEPEPAMLKIESRDVVVAAKDVLGLTGQEWRFLR